jgi:hypothetical protein
MLDPPRIEHAWRWISHQRQYHSRQRSKSNATLAKCLSFDRTISFAAALPNGPTERLLTGTLDLGNGSSMATRAHFSVALTLHHHNDVSELASHGERRAEARADRRKTSRSGRRASDPHFNWRRVTWLFAVYAIFMSVRSLPATIKRFFTRQETSPTNCA